MKQYLGIACLVFLLGGCNSYSFLDTPSGDAQLLSAARGCFDKGDYECASKYYSQVSGDSSDLANSEEAFEILAQNGMTVGIFMSAAIDGGSDSGVLITKIANALTPVAKKSTRLGIFHAYQKTSSIGDRHTQGLIRFITSISFLSEILAEDASTPGKLAKSDLVQNPVTCLASEPTFASSGCNPPAGKKIVTGQSISLPTATDTDISGPGGAPTLYMINAAIEEISTSINQMQASGDIGSSSTSFSTAVLAAATFLSLSPSAYRGTLIQFNIGE